MKIILFLFSFAPFLLSAQTCTTEKLLGTWTCTNREFGVKCLKTWVLKENEQYDWDYECEEGSHGHTAGRWWCDGDRVYQSHNGKDIFGTIVWRDDDTLELTIVDNGSNAYDGMVRIYRRVKK